MMMKKKKFIITTTIAPTLFFFRGQPRTWRKCYDVRAVSNQEDKLREFADLEGISCKTLPMHREISPVSDIINLFRFVWLFIKERPFVVHGNTPKASMLSMIAAWMTRVPVRVYMCHGLRYQSSVGTMRKILMAFEKLSCSCATRVLCVSHGVKEQFVADGICPAQKAKVILNGTAGGIDTNHFSRKVLGEIESGNLSFPPGAFVFTFAGRIVRDKGVNELVSAFNRLSLEKENVYLLLIGTKEQDLDSVEAVTLQTIETNDRIMEMGWQSDIRPFLAVTNVFVLPSYREGVGQVLLEAGCMDVPSIATDIIGCNEVIIPGVNGELVPPRDEQALFLKMKEWVESPQKVRAMAQTCRQSVVERYAQDKVWDAYLKEYESYLNG